jgi:GNAT superfamily N-acetyltransferase
VTLRSNVWSDGPVGLLDELYVAPESRRLGIGSAIIEAVLAKASADSWALIEVNVDEFDRDARRFYERHGFANTELESDERALYYWRD